MNDHYEIEAVLNRYAEVLDTKNYARLDEVFIADATAHYVGVAECNGLAEIIALVARALDQCGITQHLLGNVQTEVQGDRATASCYLQAIHVGLGDYAGQLHTVWGEYRDQLVRTANGWRISERVLTTLHAEGDIGMQLD